MRNEHDLLSEKDYSVMLREQIRLFSKSVCNDKTTIHIPSLKGHWTKIPGSFFHLEMEIFLQVSGGCVFDFPEQRIIIKQGDVLLIQPGMPHKETAFSHGDEPFRNIVYAVGDSGGKVHIAQARRSSLKAAVPDKPYIAYREVLSSVRFYPALVEALIRVQSDNLPEARELRRHLLSSFLLQSLLDLGAPGNQKPVKFGAAQTTGKQHYKVDIARKIIHEHILSPMPSVTELAAAVNFSPNHLSALFHQITGVTIKTYINDLRLDYARKLIETTAYNISEIAWSCGFQDAAYFAKIFKKRFCISPAEVRKT
jgi:AraC-like DNA-binding protein/mannose-6-phosphate isomerase-like protein (cupin superfamily)